MNESHFKRELLSSWVIGGGLALLILIALFMITAPFLHGLAWASILVLMTWPIYRWLHQRCGIRSNYSALIMTAGVTSLFFLIVIPIFVRLGREVIEIASNASFNVEAARARLLSLPILGGVIDSSHLDNILNSIANRVGEKAVAFTGAASQVVITSIFNTAIMLLSSFFLYHHGPKLVRDLNLVLAKQCGRAYLDLISVTGHTIKGVVYGALVTALAQGLIAGLGFYVAGAPLPALLGLATIIFSFIPFGAPIVYLPVVFYLAVGNGDWGAGTGLLIWGVLVVSTVDNLLRPLFISQRARLPLLIVFIGVVGGILSFGLLGLFVGPVIVAIAMDAWISLVERSKNSVST